MQWSQENRARRSNQETSHNDKRPSPEDLDKKERGIAPHGLNALHNGIRRSSHLSSWSALKSTDHHVYQLAQHKNHLHHLLICNGGANFFVGKHTLAHYI